MKLLAKLTAQAKKHFDIEINLLIFSALSQTSMLYYSFEWKRKSIFLLMLEHLSADSLKTVFFIAGNHIF